MKNFVSAENDVGMKIFWHRLLKTNFAFAYNIGKVEEKESFVLDEQEILQALEKKALGFTFDEVVEEYSQDEDGKPVLCKRKITKKINPPDLSALKFLLENGDLSDDAISKMTDKELLEQKERLLKILKEKEEKDENADV